MAFGYCDSPGTHMQRNLTHQLVHDLGLAIVQGSYAVGAALPSEAEICKQFGVSRSATREAVKMLAAKGLLNSRPRQGIRVLPEARWNMFDTEVLGWLLQSRPSRDLLLEFTQMRQGVEPSAAALAAENATPEAIADIEAALQRMADAEAGFDDALESDIGFHTSILVASGNRFYVQMSAFVETALRVSIRFTNAMKGVTGADVRAHADIYNAIRKHNPKLARRKVEVLLDESIELIEKGRSVKSTLR
jgi:DNA-binding FadR family transcriptional regulator